MQIRLLCFFFFFQAEDGIRDLTVTGVQTCALPISIFLKITGVALPQAIIGASLYKKAALEIQVRLELKIQFVEPERLLSLNLWAKQAAKKSHAARWIGLFGFARQVRVL